MSGAQVRPNLFEQDSLSYELLAEAVSLAPPNGLFLEIGLRRGGGMKVILDGVIARGLNANVVSVDCYGALPYMWREGQLAGHDYPNQMRDETVAGIYDYIASKPVNWLFLPLTDTQFFTRFADGVPIYAGQHESIASRYGLVHFDAEHTLQAVYAATRFILEERDMPGTCLCFDDINVYDHPQVERVLFRSRYEIVRKHPTRALYRRGG